MFVPLLANWSVGKHARQEQMCSLSQWSLSYFWHFKDENTATDQRRTKQTWTELFNYRLRWTSYLFFFFFLPPQPLIYLKCTIKSHKSHNCANTATSCFHLQKNSDTWFYFILKCNNKLLILSKHLWSCHLESKRTVEELYKAGKGCKKASKTMHICRVQTEVTLNRSIKAENHMWTSGA